MPEKMDRKTLGNRIAAAWRLLSKHGVRASVREVVRANSVRGLRLPLEEYEFVSSVPLGKLIRDGDVPRNTITWVIPPFAAGAGGHTTIFRFVHYLEKRGFDCRIVILGGIERGSSDHFRNLIRNSFFPIEAAIYVDPIDAPPAHATIATSWETAYLVRGIRSTVHRYYFVQDFEPWFYPVGTRYCLAEATYRFGFNGITAGTWLSQKLAQDYGMRTVAFSFSCDKSVYYPVPRERPTRTKVFFYTRPSTERRAFELGLLAIGELNTRMQGVEAIFAGSDLSNVRIPFAHRSEGIVAAERLAQLFNECDVALVLSLTNLSLLPVEIMACGTPVVSNRGPYVNWLLNETNSFLAEPTPEELAEALHKALTDENARERVRVAGMALAASTSWEEQAGRIVDVFSMVDADRMHC